MAEFAAMTNDLPRIDTERLHVFAEKVSKRGADMAWSLTRDLLRDWLTCRVRQSAATENALAQLAAWSDVWSKVEESASRTEILTLDRKHVVLTAFHDIASVLREGTPVR